MKKCKAVVMKFKRGGGGGLTFAEVLIPIGVIGIGASITIPALLNSANDREMVSKLKKAYSDLCAATNYIVSENGSISSWDWSGAGSNIDNVMNDYKKYLKFYKSCPSGDNTTCYSWSNWLNLKGTRILNNTALNGSYNNILENGTYITFLKVSNPAGMGLVSGLTSRIFILVDLNGSKNPNQVGRDIFAFYMTEEKGVIPGVFVATDMNACIPGTSVGYGCTAKVLREDAINY